MRERFVSGHQLVEQRQHVGHLSNLLVGDQDAWPVERARLRLDLVDESRVGVPYLMLQTLSKLELVFELLAGLCGRRAVSANVLPGGDSNVRALSSTEPQSL